ncbi:hypothetical protein KF840_23870 [bacterium]|nr:hypothetical protein [bacterium]
MNRSQGWQRVLPTRHLFPVIAGALAVLIAAADAASADVDEKTLRLTPARLGYVEGDVSFWRPGAGDWEAATVNIPLAAGDALATRDGRFEVQIGPQAFLRAADQTQLRVKSQEPDFLQLEVAQGSAVLDLRQLPAGHIVEIDTPQGATTVNRDGFYRVDVDAQSTRITVRRAGAASFTPLGGQPVQVATGESITLRGGAAGQLDLAAAPAFDEWDRWNYARADAGLAAPRSYAVSTDVYGVSDLDRYGGWRYVPTYGRVWVPYSVPVGWAPYSYGRWLWDPVYGYSWVDYAPWGWAPFHYGRWVYTGYWAWAPGPVVYGAVYAPALVSFFTPAVSVSVGVGVPFIGWTALGWGEPLVPWWGGVGFVGVPCWYGWGGPRVVNNIVINNYDTVHANQINVYRNASAPGGLVGVPKNAFGGPDVQRARLASLTNNDVKPLRGVTRTSLGAPAGGAAMPKDGIPHLAGSAGTPRGAGGGATQLTRQANVGGATADAVPPKPAGQGAAFDRLRGGTVEAARGSIPKAALPAVGARAPGSDTAAAPDKGRTAPFDRLRTSGTVVSPPPLPQAAPPSAGSRAPGGRVAAPPRDQSASFDRAGSGTVSRSQALPKRSLPAVPAAGSSVGSVAPPPLRGLSRPQGGSAEAYRRLGNGSLAAPRAAVAPSYPRGIAGAPVVKSGVPAAVEPSRPVAPSAGNVGRADSAAPLLPRPRAVARVDAAPMANFAPQPKPLALPSVGGGTGGGNLGAMGGGPAAGGGSGGAGGSGMGGSGGGRPSFSR